MDIISIIEQIARRKDFDFCDAENERSLERPHVCIYQNLPENGWTFVGKIRFVDADRKFKADVDPSVIEALKSEKLSSRQSVQKKMAGISPRKRKRR